MKILITGISGFVGSHLAELCLKNGCEVHGTVRWRSNLENLEDIREKITLHECDITDYFAISKIINEVKPDRIFHLAAQSFVKASWIYPHKTIETNIMGELNLFEAVRNAKYNPRIMIAGSSEEYGQVDKLPITEETPLKPLSPYAVSKVTQDMLGYQYFKSYGMHIIRTRGFNHTGPRRGDVFVCSTFAKQIVAIERGQQKTIKVGNLEAERDFTDVRDMVRAYWLALEKGVPGEVYNICSGVAFQMKGILNMLRKMSKVNIKIEVDPERMRPSDLPVLRGDNSKFVKQTGWEREVPFPGTLRDILEYWRGR